LFHESRIEITIPHFPGTDGRENRIIRTGEDVLDYLDYATGLAPEYSEMDHLLVVPGINICPVPLFTELSVELYKMHQFSKRGLYPYPGGYFDQLAIFIEASGVISSEENVLAKKALTQNGQR